MRRTVRVFPRSYAALWRKTHKMRPLCECGDCNHPDDRYESASHPDMCQCRFCGVVFFFVPQRLIFFISCKRAQMEAVHMHVKHVKTEALCHHSHGFLLFLRCRAVHRLYKKDTYNGDVISHPLPWRRLDFFQKYSGCTPPPKRL